ncbi:MAG: toll/interleukin-1 receptor domain-containing protein [Thioploca sp.]|nr:toll/interleukin-1 receptor domain-containing protein [Thioploca sp.]
MLTKDFFISYGRRESLGLVGRLHQQLKLASYDAWFDKVNIPDGDDYAERIRHGIETAHNFVYVMAPRSLTSPYCLTELEYARWLGKRVIPLDHLVIFRPIRGNYPLLTKPIYTIFMPFTIFPIRTSKRHKPC